MSDAVWCLGWHGMVSCVMLYCVMSDNVCMVSWGMLYGVSSDAVLCHKGRRMTLYDVMSDAVWCHEWRCMGSWVALGDTCQEWRLMMSWVTLCDVMSDAVWCHEGRWMMLWVTLDDVMSDAVWCHEWRWMMSWVTLDDVMSDVVWCHEWRWVINVKSDAWWCYEWRCVMSWVTLYGVGGLTAGSYCSLGVRHLSRCLGDRTHPGPGRHLALFAHFPPYGTMGTRPCHIQFVTSQHANLSMASDHEKSSEMTVTFSQHLSQLWHVKTKGSNCSLSCEHLLPLDIAKHCISTLPSG